MRRLYRLGEWFKVVYWTDVNRMARLIWWGSYSRINGDQKYALLSQLGLNWQRTLWYANIKGDAIPNHEWWPVPGSEFDVLLNERFDTITVRRARPVT